MKNRIEVEIVFNDGETLVTEFDATNKFQCKMENHDIRSWMENLTRVGFWTTENRYVPEGSIKVLTILSGLEEE